MARTRSLASSPLISLLLLLSWLALEHDRGQQGGGFEGFASYLSNAEANSLVSAPTIQVSQYELFPAINSPTLCPIAIFTGNACRVEIDSRVNFGIAAVTEVHHPNDVASTIDGIQGRVTFNPNSGQVRVIAFTPGADQGQFKSASARLVFAYNFRATPRNRYVRLTDFVAETVGQIAGGGADIDIHLSRPSAEAFWQVFGNLRFTDSYQAAPDQRVDLLEFVGSGDNVTLTVEVFVLAYSATVQIGSTDPSLGALPAQSAVSFRLKLPKQ